MFILPILYVYYKIWFNFDINTLDKDIKKGTKIINEHSNITTIIKSGSGTAISTARLELYKHSYFMNLYKNAFENYAEKIIEIEGYNKSLLSQEQQPQEELKLKLKEKNKELTEKVNDSNIYREQIKSKKKELKDFNSNNDDTLRDFNKDIYKNMLKIGDKKPGDAIKDIKGKKNELLDKKEEIKKGLSELKSKENEARSAIKKIGADMKDNFISNLGKKLPDMQKIKKLGNIVNNNIGDKIGDKIGNIIDKVKI
jgi:hypothetical protein